MLVSDISAIIISLEDKALIINGEASDFISAIAQHRNWERMAKTEDIPV